MTIAGAELKLDALCVVYPGERRLPLGPGIGAVPLCAALGPDVIDAPRSDRRSSDGLHPRAAVARQRNTPRAAMARA